MRRFKPYNIFILLVFSFLLTASCKEHREKEVIKEYYKSDALKTKVVYDDPKDTTNYEVSVYHKNGNLKKHYNIKQNKLSGTTYAYYKNGNLENITNYKNGKEHGINKIYNKNGNIVKRSLYIEGAQKVYEVDMINDKGWEKRISHLVKNGKAYPVGEVVNDSNGKIIRDKTFYYELIVQDTVCFREKFNIKVIPLLNTCNNKCFIEIKMGDLNSKLQVKNNCESNQKFLENLDTLIYENTPDELGYNSILGIMLVKSKKDSSIRDRIVIFDDVFVNNCNK